MREPAPEVSSGGTAVAPGPAGPPPAGPGTPDPVTSTTDPAPAAGHKPPAGATRPAPRRTDKLGTGFWALFAAMFVANLGSGITTVAFPWLTTEMTTDPLLVAGVGVAAELPWLLFSLPAGVLVDRYEHRRLISSTHLGRALVVGLLAVVLFADVASIWMVYLVAFTIGALTVLNENATQTILPRIVRPSQLNRANSNLVLADTTGGVFLGPAIGGLLLTVAVTLPFAVDAALYLLAAGLILLVTVSARRTAPAAGTLPAPPVGTAPGPVPAAGAAAETAAATDPVGGPARRSLRTEMAEGARYFWNHRVLRQLGIFLGLLNLASSIIVGTQVLFAQEILNLSAAQYGVLFAVGAVGAAAGAGLAPMLEARLGARRVLLLTLFGNSAVSLTIGFTSNALLVALALTVGAGLAVVWNVVTISYRQRIVPEHMLGRVNSIYRLLAWGPLSAGSLIGGLVVKLGEPLLGRESALRAPLFLSGTLTAVLICYALIRLRDGIWSRDRNAVYGPDDPIPEEEDGMAEEQLTDERPGGTAAPPLPAFGGTGGADRPVLKTLISINVLIAVAGLVMIGLEEGLTPAAAIWDGVSPLHLATEMNGPAVDRGEVWRLVSSMFVHYGLAHLVANMVMLGLAGWKLEPILGSRRFLELYLLSGLGAGIATYLFTHDALTAGASGANFGVFAALLVVCLKLRQRSVLAIVLLAFGVVTTFAIPGMAIAAHIAGLVVGTAVAAGYALPTGDRRDRLRVAVPVGTLVVLLLVAVVALLL
ncbi:MFS transporter [Polymorphospora sp. NPDC051019]|uniref:MFS transporter n=1 Tax=Polymorphospora sp. NPDC051019 TaxID=3155725 RepID=UPI0034477BAE